MNSAHCRPLDLFMTQNGSSVNGPRVPVYNPEKAGLIGFFAFAAVFKLTTGERKATTD